jgi:hypothetical protein
VCVRTERACQSFSQGFQQRAHLGLLRTSTLYTAAVTEHLLQAWTTCLCGLHLCLRQEHCLAIESSFQAPQHRAACTCAPSCTLYCSRWFVRGQHYRPRRRHRWQLLSLPLPRVALRRAAVMAPSARMALRLQNAVLLSHGAASRTRRATASSHTSPLGPVRPLQGLRTCGLSVPRRAGRQQWCWRHFGALSAKKESAPPPPPQQFDVGDADGAEDGEEEEEYDELRVYLLRYAGVTGTVSARILLLAAATPFQTTTNSSPRSTAGRLHTCRQLLADALSEGTYRLAGLSEEEDVELVGIATAPEDVEVGDLFVSLKVCFLACISCSDV